MNQIYELLINNYGYDEPIFSKELVKEIDYIKQETVRTNLKRLTDQGKIIRVDRGIYYIPKKKSFLKKPKPNLDKVLYRKYIEKFNKKRVGYESGVNFANKLGLTSQTASISVIITNETNLRVQEERLGNKKVFLKKSIMEVTQENYKFLQVMDLLNDYERVSEEPLDNASDIICSYLENVQISITEIENVHRKYDKKTVEIAKGMKIFDEIARTRRCIQRDNRDYSYRI